MDAPVLLGIGPYCWFCKRWPPEYPRLCYFAVAHPNLFSIVWYELVHHFHPLHNTIDDYSLDHYHLNVLIIIYNQIHKISNLFLFILFLFSLITGLEHTTSHCFQMIKWVLSLVCTSITTNKNCVYTYKYWVFRILWTNILGLKPKFKIDDLNTNISLMLLLKIDDKSVTWYLYAWYFSWMQCIAFTKTYQSNSRGKLWIVRYHLNLILKGLEQNSYCC